MTACTLHKLIEQIEDGSLRLGGAMNRDRAVTAECMHLVQTVAPRAMCFCMGHESLSEGVRQIPELFRLPYEVCWFEGEYDGPNGEAGRVGFFCREAGDFIHIQLYGWARDVGKWVLHDLAAARFDPARPDRIVGACASEGAEQKNVYMTLVCWLSAFLSALNCCNVNRIKTTTDEKLQRARSKRGKKPLFDFWTLEIDLDRSEKEDCDWGGTHASPRFHLRRGHARQHKKGHWCWVRACAVGNKQSGGMVHKEYAAR